MAVNQLTLDFTPGLTAQYRSLREVTAATVYASRKGVAGVAGDIDMAPTDLTKRLNLEGSEPRPLRVDDFEGILASTNDYRPIYWLIERFLRDPESVKQQAVSQIATLLPQLSELIRQAGIKA